MQERETTEKLRIRVRELELSAEQQQQQQQARPDQLDDSRKPTSDSQDELKQSRTHDLKTWKLRARLGEEKVRELEKDIEKKVR